ncbi:hypothetical protein C0995_010257 [Termitomyces sp. Mi166|nr:hypothetical protein C0995_010257 [Termitomyces sp. Mi166\
MTTPQPPPVAPTHLLRTHSSSVSTVFVSSDNERIYSGDASGLVVVTSTRSLRPITKWSAHTDSLLGIEEWGNRVITHARDNKLHIWTRVQELPLSARVGSVAQSVGEQTIPQLCYSMDVNALNYCRFSLLPNTSDEAQALVALPNLVDSTSDEPSSSTSGCELRLLCAYESGSVTLRRYARADKATSVEGAGWEVIWDVKVHAETKLGFVTVMAMRVSRNNRFALTVSADHLVGWYDLTLVTARMLFIRPSIRLYSTRTMKPLGTLKYHKAGCQGVEFAHSLDTVMTNNVDEEVNDDSDSEEELSESEKEKRAQWLIAGGKDNRVSIWTLMNFAKS